MIHQKDPHQDGINISVHTLEKLCADPHCTKFIKGVYLLRLRKRTKGYKNMRTKRYKNKEVN